MALLALWLTLAVVACLVQSGLAGPACARKYYKTSECVQKCKSRWGFPGSMMGTDPWGAVMLPTSATIDDYISTACGQTTNATSSVGPTQNISGNNGTNSSSESLSISSSAVTFTISSSLISSASISATSSASSPLATFNSSVGIEASAKPTSSRRLSSSTTISTRFTSHIELETSTIPKPSTTSTSFTTPKPTTSSTPLKTTEATHTPASPTSEASAATTVSSSSGNGSGASDSDVQTYLAAHNTVRAQHGASPLTWSNDAASKAQEWANNCQFKHSGGSLGPFGENLAAGTGSGYTIDSAITSWTNEVSQYDSSNPQPSHFTQVVWKATTQVGCAVQDCSGIFAASFGLAHFYVCEYSIQGNVIGEFAENVQA